MFLLQLVVVVLMSLMGAAVQEASFHSLSCSHPTKGHNSLCAATEEVLRVLLPQEFCRGGQGSPAFLWGLFHLSSSPGRLRATTGAPGVALRAGCSWKQPPQI